MKPIKILIVGSRAAGLYLSVFLKKNACKFFIGRGIPQNYLTNRLTIISGLKKDIDLLEIDNIYNYDKINDEDEISAVIFAVRENDLINIDENTLSLCNLTKNILVLINNYSSFNEFKSYIPSKNILPCIINNGIKYLSPSLIYALADKHELIIDSEKEKAPNIFEQSKVVFLNNENRNRYLLERYFKTSLTYLSIIKKTSIGGLIEHHEDTMFGLYNELSKYLGNEEKHFFNIINSIKDSPAILAYYPSEYEAFYLRDKELNYIYFYRDCSQLFLNDFSQQKFLNYLFNEIKRIEKK